VKRPIYRDVGHGVPYKGVVALSVASPTSSRGDVTAVVSDERRTTREDADETPTGSSAP
jgi:hypothetical protein